MVEARPTLQMITTPAYTTGLGAAYCGDSLDLLAELPDASVNLVITSPPFALQRQKAYGNKGQAEYVEWLTQFARQVYRVLRNDGSFVLDLGGAYEKGLPTRSLYNFRVLIKFHDEIGFHLAEDFYWFNPSKLPNPIRVGEQAQAAREGRGKHGVVVQQNRVAESRHYKGAGLLQRFVFILVSPMRLITAVTTSITPVGWKRKENPSRAGRGDGTATVASRVRQLAFRC
jgi:hypothetical protein